MTDAPKCDCCGETQVPILWECPRCAEDNYKPCPKCMGDYGDA